MTDVDFTMLQHASPADELRLGFKPEGLRWIRLLWLMIRDGYLYAKPTERQHIAELSQASVWPSFEERTFMVTITDDFQAPLFITAMEQGLESLELVPIQNDPFLRQPNYQYVEVDLEKVATIFGYRFTTAAFARLVGVKHNTAKDWSRAIGKNQAKLYRQPDATKAIDELHAILAKLTEQRLTAAEARAWWDTPNPLLDNQQPARLFVRAEFARVREVVEEELRLVEPIGVT